MKTLSFRKFTSVLLTIASLASPVTEAGVLKTAPTSATADLIIGWYAASNPMLNPLNYNQNYVPTAAGLSWLRAAA